MKHPDLTGQKFHRLLVMSFRGKNAHRRSTWNCLCDCGKSTIVDISSLRRESTKSCGCWLRERLLMHGHSRRGGTSHSYGSWAGMIQRCTNPESESYKYYGGRGIKICKRWRKFANFLADMGEPAPGLSIDRVNNNGNYEPGNCRWATAEQQANNARSVWAITSNGKTQSAARWAREFGIDKRLIYERIKRGWPLGPTLFIPPNIHHRRPYLKESA